MDKMNHGAVKYQLEYCAGIRASAGGMKALQELFRNMPLDTDASFITAQHLSPGSASMMGKILQKSVKMSVRLAGENMELRPNEAYSNIPGMVLEVGSGRPRLSPVHDRVQRYAPINQMLDFLASDKNVRTIAVILSSSGSGGTIDISSVRENGGTITVQKLLEAQHASIPQSAIATGLTDLTENVSEVGLATRDYLKNPNSQYLHHDDGVENQELTGYYSQIIDAILKYSNIDFSTYKPNIIHRRIGHCIVINKYTCTGDYMDHLLTSEEEKRLSCSDLSIGVTSLFRDEAASKGLGGHILAPLFREKKSIRIRSTACPAGEEVYSITISLCECMEQLNYSADVKIFASDTDPDAIAAAQRGFYTEDSLANINKLMIGKYSDKKEDSHIIKDIIRKMIVSAKHNMFRDTPFSKLDLVVCRNMFIYVKPEVQQRTIRNFHHPLSDDGYLFLGNGESLDDLEEAFDVLDRKWKIFHKSKELHTESNSFYLWDNLPHPQKTVQEPVRNLRPKV